MTSPLIVEKLVPIPLDCPSEDNFVRRRREILVDLLFDLFSLGSIHPPSLDSVATKKKVRNSQKILKLEFSIIFGSNKSVANRGS